MGGLPQQKVTGNGPMEAGEDIETGPQADDDDLGPLEDQATLQPGPLLGIGEARPDGGIKQISKESADINQDKPEHEPLVKGPAQVTVENQNSQEPGEQPQIANGKKIGQSGMAHQGLLPKRRPPPHEVQVQLVQVGVIKLGMQYRNQGFDQAIAKYQTKPRSQSPGHAPSAERRGPADGHEPQPSRPKDRGQEGLPESVLRPGAFGETSAHREEKKHQDQNRSENLGGGKNPGVFREGVGK